MSLDFQQIGKYTTKVVGTQEQIEELRKKMQDIGIHITNDLYLQLRVVPKEINDLKQKYNIEKTEEGISIHIPDGSAENIDKIFNGNNNVQLHFPEKTINYNFTRDGKIITVTPPIDYPLPESLLITNSLKLLQLCPSE